MKYLQNNLSDWEKETNKLVKYFTKIHFGKDAETYWIADEVGGLYYVNDYFFDFSQIVRFVRCKYSTEEIFSYYEYTLKKGKRNTVNIENYRELVLNK